MDKPQYSYSPIGTVKMLSTTLGVRESLLVDVSKNIEDSYIEILVPKKDGTDRLVLDAKYYLKRIQKLINKRIFEKVIYPDYLMGGIKCPKLKRDYVRNAEIHAGMKHIVSLDIKNFFNNIRYDYVYSLFKNFFSFSDEVAKILTDICTYKGFLPQGACISTYIANLIFFNSEYILVSRFRGKGLNYSRLIDDITVSSPELIPDSKMNFLFKECNAMFKKHGVKINNKKTVISSSKHSKEHHVTGLWAGHSTPKIRKKERRYVRQLVYECEKSYLVDKTHEDYHLLWNSTSGKVAKIQRLGHIQGKGLRERLSKVMPEYNKSNELKVKKYVYGVLKIKKSRVGLNDIKKINKAMHKLGILSRSNPKLSKNLRDKIKNRFGRIASKSELWG